MSAYVRETTPVSTAKLRLTTVSPSPVLPTLPVLMESKITPVPVIMRHGLVHMYLSMVGYRTGSML